MASVQTVAHIEPVLTVSDLENNSERLGFSKAVFNGYMYYRFAPEGSRFARFDNGFYPSERMFAGRWCSPTGTLSLLLAPGEWEIILLFGGQQLWKSPEITSNDAAISIEWIEGDNAWDAARVTAALDSAKVTLLFAGRHCFVPKATNPNNSDPRTLCFWMLDEILLRPKGKVFDDADSAKLLSATVAHGALAGLPFGSASIISPFRDPAWADAREQAGRETYLRLFQRFVF